MNCATSNNTQELSSEELLKVSGGQIVLVRATPDDTRIASDVNSSLDLLRATRDAIMPVEW